MVGLSGLDSNKYAKLIGLKRKTPVSPELCPKDTLSKTENPVKRTNEYGEPEVLRISRQQKQLSDAEKLEAIKEYLSGKTVLELAKNFGCHKVTISRALKAAGIRPDNRTAQKKLDVNAVISMYKDFHTTAEIAERFGVNPNAIIKCLRDNDVPIRNRWDYPRK